MTKNLISVPSVRPDQPGQPIVICFFFINYIIIPLLLSIISKDSKDSKDKLLYIGNLDRYFYGQYGRWLYIIYT